MREIASANGEFDAAMAPGPADVNACADVGALRGMLQLTVRQLAASERLATALESANAEMRHELLELRRELAGGPCDGEDLSEPFDVCALDADAITAVLTSDACKEYIAEKCEPINRLLFKGIVQLSASKSPHARNGLRFDPLDIHLCNAIKVHSNSAYKAILGMGVPLAGLGSLRAATEPVSGHPGYLPERTALYKAGCLADGLSLSAPVNVSIDGLSLRAGIWYSVSRRSVEGFSFVWSDYPPAADPAADDPEAAVPDRPPLAAGGAKPEAYRGAFTGKLAKHAASEI